MALDVCHFVDAAFTWCLTNGDQLCRYLSTLINFTSVDYYRQEDIDTPYMHQFPTVQLISSKDCLSVKVACYCTTAEDCTQ